MIPEHLKSIAERMAAEQRPPAQKTQRVTLLVRAAEIGCSVPTLRNWKRGGTDVFDDEDVRRRIAKMRSLPPDLKPEWHPKTASITMPDGSDPTQIDIEEIIRQISTATDKHSAQTVKTQIDALLNAYKLREAAGKYVPKSIVEEALMRIGSAVKGAVLRMEADLPPMLEGATPAAMQRMIREKTDEVMATLSDAAADVWKDAESTDTTT